MNIGNTLLSTACITLMKCFHRGIDTFLLQLYSSIKSEYLILKVLHILVSFALCDPSLSVLHTLPEHSNFNVCSVPLPSPRADHQSYLPFSPNQDIKPVYKVVQVRDLRFVICYLREQHNSHLGV